MNYIITCTFDIRHSYAEFNGVVIMKSKYPITALTHMSEEYLIFGIQ